MLPVVITYAKGLVISGNGTPSRRSKGLVNYKENTGLKCFKTHTSLACGCTNGNVLSKYINVHDIKMSN